MLLVRAEVRRRRNMRCLRCCLFKGGCRIACVGHDQVLCFGGAKTIMQAITARERSKRIPGDLQLSGRAYCIPLAFRRYANEVSSSDNFDSRNILNRVFVNADDFWVAKHVRALSVSPRSS